MVLTFAEGHNTGLWGMFVQHSERCCRWRCGHDAVVSERYGSERCRADHPSSFLGQLGGLRSHFFCKTPRRGHTHHPEDARPRAVGTDMAQQLVSVEGFESPSWEAFASSQRPPRREPENYEPRGCRHSWQLEAASQVER